MQETDREAPDTDPEEDGHDIIYTLRTAHQNQTQHLMLADQKANVLVGIVAVILTILLTRTNILTGSEPAMRNIVLAFVFIELVALFLAILVITPKTVNGARPGSIDGIPNPLFFGYFTRFSEEEYLDYMQRKLSGTTAARRVLVADLYQIGQVLNRKFRLLKLAYIATATGFLFLFLSIGWLALAGANSG